MNKEIWKIIPFHQDYMVSNLGNVKRIKAPWEGKIIKPRTNPYGYYEIRNSKTNKHYPKGVCCRPQRQKYNK